MKKSLQFKHNNIFFNKNRFRITKNQESDMRILKSALVLLCYFEKIKVENVIFRLISAIYFENHVQIDPIRSVKS